MMKLFGWLNWSLPIGAEARGVSDKLISLPVQRIGPLIGELDQASMKRLAVALRFWID